MKILANDGISNEGKLALENSGFIVVTDKVDQSELASKISFIPIASNSVSNSQIS